MTKEDILNDIAILMADRDKANKAIDKFQAMLERMDIEELAKKEQFWFLNCKMAPESYIKGGISYRSEKDGLWLWIYDSNLKAVCLELDVDFDKESTDLNSNSNGSFAINVQCQGSLHDLETKARIALTCLADTIHSFTYIGQ